jgi:uncharacterized protein YqeY
MLLDRIKADRIGAMKERDDVRKNLLGTLLGAATKDSKTPDDEVIVRTIRSFLKSLDETIGLVEGRGGSAGQQRAEKAILEGYLPLEASIAAIVAGLPERSPKAMGQVMAALKAKHGDALDARAASVKVKATLS